MCKPAEPELPATSLQEEPPTAPRPRRDAADRGPSDAFTQVAPIYDQLMSNVPYQQWVDYVEALLLARDARPAVALDLACGTGQVGAELRRRGYRVVGVDLSAGMVRTAHRLGRLPAAVQDAAQLGLRAGAFDLVVCLYDSLNYILEPERLGAAFAGVRHCLRPGGYFIFDLNTIRALRIGLFNQSNLRGREELQYEWRAAWDADHRICTVRMWFRHQERTSAVEFEEVHCQRGYTEEEVVHLLREAGLRVDAVYNAYTFRRVNRWSTRAFYVTQKPV